MAYFGTGPSARPASNPAAASARPAFNRGSGSPAPRTPAAERKNKFGARCVDCGVWVPEGVGRLTKDRTNQWVVSHIPPCPTSDGPPEVPADKPAAPAAEFSVPDGRYTVIWEDGYKTIRVSHQDELDTFMPGKVILGYLSGSDNGRDYTSFAHVADDGAVRIWKKHQGVVALREAVKVLLGDPKAASKAYARESGCCGVCGRTLTTPESLEAGIGPVCAAKTGF